MTRPPYPPTAQATARALGRWCEANAVQYKFLPVNGAGHPMIRVRHKDQTRKIAFSATPSDKRRGSLNAVSQLKRALRDIGWTPRKTENDPMRMVSQNLSKFDSRQASAGAASECKITRFKPPVVAGVEIPLAYVGYTPGRGRGTTEEESRVVAARNAAMLRAKEAGAHDGEIHKALASAGWGVQKNSVSSLIAQQKRLEGKPVAARNFKKSKPVETGKPKIAKTKPVEGFGGDSLIIEIAQAIAPILARRLGESRSLKEKADKWDAIRDLIGDDAA